MFCICMYIGGVEGAAGATRQCRGRAVMRGAVLAYYATVALQCRPCCNNYT
jgi:hypothetical protein